MKRHHLKQLANYSAMAGAFILINENADAQIIYHDIDPDTMLTEDLDRYYLDMDLDGLYNFRLSKDTFYTLTEYGFKTILNLGIDGNTANDNIAASYGLASLNSSWTTWFYAPYVLSAGSLVGNALEFRQGYDLAHLQHSYSAGGGWGNWWPDTEDKYLGVRFEDVDGETHYGWIRCSVTDDYILTIKDYAYNSTPDAPIIAGATLLIPAVTNWIEVSDAGNNISGEDLHFSFQKSSDDDLILEYRVIAVKDSAADDFDLNDAVNVLTGNYLSVAPDGSEIYSGDFSGIYDADGDIISNNIPYRLFVYLVGDIAAGEADTLSPASEPITIQTITEAVTDITITDIADNGNASDIKLYFNNVASEQVIESYRAYILDIITAFGGFTVADALSVSPDHYLEFLPAGAPIDLSLPSGLTDINGIPITWGVPYFIYVMSVDNGLGTGNVIAEPSNEIILNFPTAISDPIQNPFEIFASNGIIHIQSMNNISNQTAFYLTDATGKIIYSGEIKESETTIDLNLPAGIYIATIYSGDKMYTKKIVLQN